jgi:hypothetical protein
MWLFLKSMLLPFCYSVNQPSTRCNDTNSQDGRRGWRGRQVRVPYEYSSVLMLTTSNRRYEGDELIAITLDASDKTYTVRKVTLCASSPYFEIALNGAFSESFTKSLRLPGCDNDTFTHFLYWLFHRHLSHALECEMDNRFPFPLRGDHGAGDSTWNQCRLVRLWCFGDAY